MGMEMGDSGMDDVSGTTVVSAGWGADIWGWNIERVPKTMSEKIERGEKMMNWARGLRLGIEAPVDIITPVRGLTF